MTAHGPAQNLTTVIENTRSEAATALIFQTSEVLSINFNLDEGEVRGRGDLQPHSSSLCAQPMRSNRHAEDRLRTHSASDNCAVPQLGCHRYGAQLVFCMASCGVRAGHPAACALTGQLHVYTVGNPHRPAG